MLSRYLLLIPEWYRLMVDREAHALEMVVQPLLPPLFKIALYIMIVRYMIVKEPRRRVRMFENEPHYRLLTCLFNEHLLYTGNNVIDYLHEPRFHYAHYLSFKRSSRSMNSTKVKNRCLFSGQARAVLSLFRMSRFTLKMFARNGRLNGVQKSSW
jgi:ribosomal protein S14